MKSIGSCDVCGMSNVTVTEKIIYGTDTACCLICGGSFDADEIGHEIERLTRSAESGEQWAYICALEARLQAV